MRPEVRPYAAADKAACLAIFEGNCPQFFAPWERAEFERFLHELPVTGWPYLVLEGAGQVLACGGLIPEPQTGVASFSWGMVARGVQAQGLGRQLTEARLALARGLPGLAVLSLSTSQHTQGFYARFGFEVTEIVADGFAPGLDRWEMRLALA